MNHYSDELKASLIARMLAPHNEPVAKLAHETGIPTDTLYTWRRKTYATFPESALRNATCYPSSETKFAMVVETASLNEIEAGEYCRKKGVYPEQLKRWREICTQANVQSLPVDRVTLRDQAREIRRLTAELTRMERALAETAAILVLEKKIQNLWAVGASKSPSRSA